MHTKHTTRTTRDLRRLAKQIDSSFPPLTSVERRIALAVHRCMARSAEPVDTGQIAEAVGEPSEAVEATLGTWPGVYRDDDDRIVGFWGLALRPMMAHRLHVDGRALHTWCAWDALFLPEILGIERAGVESVCPETERPIVLTVTAAGIEDPRPPATCLTMVDPDRVDVEGEGVISSFCHHIHFVASPEDGERWIRETENGAFLLTLEEGWELGRLANRLRYGDALAEGFPWSC